MAATYYHSGNDLATSPLYANVTPSDGTDLAYISRWLIIGVAGNIKVTPPLGAAAVTIAVPAGVIPIQAARVWSTGTTATGIVALY
jgi:hypothetical protein